MKPGPHEDGPVLLEVETRQWLEPERAQQTWRAVGTFPRKFKAELGRPADEWVRAVAVAQE